MKQFFKVEITSIDKSGEFGAAAELNLSYKDYCSNYTVWLEEDYFDTDDNDFATNIFLSAVPTEYQFGDSEFENLIQISLDELFLNHKEIAELIRESVDQETSFAIDVPLNQMAFDLEYILFDEIIVKLIGNEHDNENYLKLVGYLADLITYNPQITIEGVDYIAHLLRARMNTLTIDLFERNNFEKVILALTTAEIQKRYA